MVAFQISIENDWQEGLTMVTRPVAHSLAGRKMEQVEIWGIQTHSADLTTKVSIYQGITKNTYLQQPSSEYEGIVIEMGSYRVSVMVKVNNLQRR